jgi:hypothetical protein
MRFILLMMSDYADWRSMSAGEAKAFDQAIHDLNEDLRQSGAFVSAEGLDEPGSGRSVRFSNGRSATVEGTYAPGDVQLAGYWIIESGSVDSAAAWAERVPLRNGAVEVRHLMPPE